MKIDWKLFIVLLSIIGIMLFMFKLGRNSVSVPSINEVTYLRSDTVFSEVYIPAPLEETTINIDTASILRYCIENNLYSYLIPVVEKEKIIYRDVDTLAILKDWLTLRNYDLTLFDNDTLGKLTVDTKIQYNKLKSFNYSYSPIAKVTTITREKKSNFSVTVNVGLNTKSQIIVNPNIYFNNGLGFGLIHSNDFKGDKSSGIMVGYKF